MTYREIPQFNRTLDALERIKGSPEFSDEAVDGRLGTFLGRSIIARDQPIRGGVYLGGYGREAIVVDEQHGRIGLVYRLLEDRISQRIPSIEFACRSVLEQVLDVMPYRADIVEKIAADLKMENDQKISLDYYIQKRGGVCRHQALLAGALFEKLIENGILNGKVSVDRNFIPDKGAHVWARFTANDGTVYIIDPAQRFFGRLEEASNARWSYARPGKEWQKMQSLRALPTFDDAAGL